MTKAPTRDELERMKKQCDDRPQGNVWNWKVADLIGHYLELLDEVEQCGAHRWTGEKDA